MNQRILRLLLDQDVFRNGQVAEQVTVTEKSCPTKTAEGWGRLLGFDRQYSSTSSKKMREDETHRQESRGYIAALAKAAYEKNVVLLTSVELLHERSRQKMRLQLLGFNVFDVVDIGMVKSPVMRNHKTGPIAFGRAANFRTSRDDQLEFFDGITHPRYLQLKKHLGNHSADAFHYWTAEVNGLDGFVTLDTKFHNAFSKQSVHFRPTSSVYSPKGICERLGITPIDVDGIVLEKLSGLEALKHTNSLAYVALGIN